MNKGFRTLGFVTRACSNFTDTKTFFLLFNAYVRSKLEYASVIWNSSLTKLDPIEKVQKKFLRYVYYRVHGTYPHYSLCPISTADLLKEFNCDELYSRRILTDQIFLFQILKGAIDCPQLLQSLSFHVPSRTTRLKELFHIKICKTCIFDKSPVRRAMKNFNDFTFDPFFEFSR